MLRRWHQIAIATIELSALLFVVSFVFAAKYQICGLDEYTHAKECAEYHAGPFVLLWIVKGLDSHNGLVTAIATVFVAGFTWTLWRTSQKQGKLTERAIEISHRGLTIAQWPLLYIDEQRFLTPASRPIPSMAVHFAYKVTLHGGSPAIIRAIYGEMIFDTAIPAHRPTRRDWRVAHGIHQPGWALNEAINWNGDAIISTTRERIAARKAGKWLFAIGCIVYDDLFGNQHEFAFCYRGALAGGSGIRAGGDAYNYHRLREEAERAEIDMVATPPPIEPPEPPAPLVAGRDIPG